MKEYFVYPQIFTWEDIVPVEYPFVNIHGPDGAVGILLVFSVYEEYLKFCGKDFRAPLKIQQGEKNGEQNGSGTGES